MRGFSRVFHSRGVRVVSAALEALERLEDQDLKKIYVDGLDDETTGGEFLMEDERTGESRVVPSTFPQVPILDLQGGWVNGYWGLGILGF